MDSPIRSIDDHLIDMILEREGSTFTDDPLDRGGATKFGITQRNWDDYRVRARPMEAALTLPPFVRDITEPMAREFYRLMYVAPLGWIEDIDLRHLVLDCSVLHGATRATMWMQRAAGCLHIDGVIGPETRELVNATKFTSVAAELKIEATYASVLAQRFRFIAVLVAREPTQVRFLRGWIERCVEFIR